MSSRRTNRSTIRFLCVYIREAHAMDVWPIDGPQVAEPKTTEQRLQTALEFKRNCQLSWPMAIDGIEDSFLRHFAPWPFRFYVFRGSRLELKTAPVDGTHQFDEVEAEQSIVDSWSVPQKLGVSHGKWTILTLLETFGQGYLRSFVEFLKSGSRRGQQSLDAHVVRSSREPRPPRAVDAEVTLKLVSADEFDVGPEDANAEVPWTLRQALAARPDGRAAPSANHWRFPASSGAPEWNPDFRCRVNGVPSWVLKHVPAFATAAEQVKATAALRLSAATRRLLAELPPAPAPSTPAGSSALSARMLPSAEDLKLDGLGGTLLPFQVEAVQYGLARNGRLLLGDEMGLGKTVTTLALVRHFKESWPFLVVAPAPLCKLWQEHALAWLKEDLKPHDVVLIRSAQDSIPSRARMVVVSYNLISDPKFQRKDDKDFDLVILDECHLLRGNSQRSKACVPLAKKAMRAILLTGTPLVARTQDAYPLLDALFDLCTPTDFAQRYAPSTSSRNQGRSARLNELHVLLGAAMLRRTKENTLSELPAKRRQRVLLDMSPSAEKEDVEEESERLAKTKSTAVAEYMSCLTSADVRFLVFAHHLAMLDELESSLQRASVTYIRIDGSTPMAERSKCPWSNARLA
ncbi:DNA annealing helicase and endonuclease ZRANB3 (Annealing helicase 2) (AH2) (Zinc finger Ran-binding domain-containing protein 3) [Includes: DNA annealing helicase ZRANB3 [Durusdinium trenchii]|uniref:DNA annealing helicase and endonuclease ZRANB3 (Annealing helicase 2) (AH2) (Zinc finger Ran-binding domain-containing protein 3) n=1 Tax=Durusdinium trenchii TaxID=1381693 RepID=A0ABP0IF41_9DINO